MIAAMASAAPAFICEAKRRTNALWARAALPRVRVHAAVRWLIFGEDDKFDVLARRLADKLLGNRYEIANVSVGEIVRWIVR